ncbi:PQQ-dependent sugar dehydrogenase [Sphingomonas sp. S2-65]|uniref:PQQ-dependent sugar dehydrogenase n=1 Tax=Sphingomonas sp. S2-65 TaxID=2903960 RepID=UPI001F18C7AC|nr:PQQ-dependent sugar dehydrogenase [Sphingomonas sp. S2-65]UYY56893.1 PQQ-dependent sugar dehydrogenase [Sphingomonas sp. S2-65]
MSAARWLAAAALLALTACGGSDGNGAVVAPTPTPSPSPSPSPSPTSSPTPAPPITAVQSTVVASFDSPWAMTFLPDGRMLVTEKAGTLRIATTAGLKSAPLGGVPAVRNQEQGGLLDVALHPGFATNRLVYLSYAEPQGGISGLAIARGTLTEDAGGARLANVTVIWRQTPKVSDPGQYGGRMAFGPDGKLYVTAGDRRAINQVQSNATTIGKVVRLNDDGTPASGNPFAGTAGALAEIWTLGHRNPYGLAFDAAGRLWESEMGPAGGDELNLITAGRNYGWPNVSNGNNYDGSNIPDHSPGDGYEAPVVSWSPVIAPGGMIIYTGDLFAAWKGDAILAGLVGQGLIRVDLDGTSGREAQRIGLGQRIREVEQGPDGAIWVLEDNANGRLIRLVPR